MDISKLRDRITDDLCKAIPADQPAATRDEISRIVGEALLEATGHAHARSMEAVVMCCGPDADLAHKIQSQLDRQRDKLVANLMALR